MKRLRFCAAVVLLLALSLTTFAGEIGLPGITQPPPSATTVGDIHTPGITSSSPNQLSVTGDMDTPTVTAIDSATGLALYLFNSVISVF